MKVIKSGVITCLIIKTQAEYLITKDEKQQYRANWWLDQAKRLKSRRVIWMNFHCIKKAHQQYTITGGIEHKNAHFIVAHRILPVKRWSSHRTSLHIEQRLNADIHSCHISIYLSTEHVLWLFFRKNAPYAYRPKVDLLLSISLWESIDGRWWVFVVKWRRRRRRWWWWRWWFVIVGRRRWRHRIVVIWRWGFVVCKNCCCRCHPEEQSD